jgi:Ca-activated chloride channel family protein
MILTLLGTALLVVTLANPLMGKKQEKGKRSGSDIAICLDVSNSMMAEDVKPNRLSRSKQVVNNLLNTMTGDRVSLIVYAGTSFIEMPLTNDYNAAKLFLDQVDCSMIAAQGTAIGDAIGKAMETFGYGDEDREWVANKGRAIIVISDGENHEDDAVGAAKKAYKEGIRVCTIGLGGPEGTPIPTGNGAYRRDKDGNVIITRLNEQMLRDIAKAGKGVYVSGTENIDEITSLLENLEKNDFEEEVFSSYESRYQYPLAAGLFLLLAEVFVFERRNKKKSK